jgi:hypothetical protein
MKKLLDSFLDEKTEFLRLLKQHNLQFNEHESMDYHGKLVDKVSAFRPAGPLKFVVVEFDKSKKLINFYCPFNSSLLRSQIDLEWLPSDISSWLYDKYLGY